MTLIGLLSIALPPDTSDDRVRTGHDVGREVRCHGVAAKGTVACARRLAGAGIDREIPRSGGRYRNADDRGSRSTASASAACAAATGGRITSQRFHAHVPAHRLDARQQLSRRERQLAHGLSGCVRDPEPRVDQRLVHLKVDQRVVRRVLAEEVLVAPELVVEAVLRLPLQRGGNRVELGVRRGLRGSVLLDRLEVIEDPDAHARASRRASRCRADGA